MPGHVASFENPGSHGPPRRRLRYHHQMSSLPSRARVRAALIEVLSTELAGVEHMARLAADEATSEETRSEGKYDTRSIEASYLARGQAERVAALRAALAAARALSATSVQGDRPVGQGCLVVLEDEEEARRVLLMMGVGGGTKFVADGVSIGVITPSSPLGRALLGASEGDEVEVDVGARVRGYEVVEVR